MTGTIEIRNMRLSFVWFQPVLEHWRDGVALQPAMSFLADVDKFANQFVSIKAAPAGGLSLPWSTKEGHHFWEHFLERAKYEEAESKVYRKQLVPLREKPGFSITADWFPGRLVPEVYYFPFGAAFLLTASYTGKPITFQEAVALAHDLQHNKKLTLDNSGKVDRKLNDLGMDVLDSLVQRILGASAGVAVSVIKPFSLFTVMQGKCDDHQPAADGSEIHRCLNALTEWSPSWESDGLPPLANYSLHDKDWPPSHLIYTRDRGHAIWFPEFLADKYNEKHLLSCYFRNQLLDAMMIEGLSRFLVETAQLLKVGKAIPPAELDCAGLAANLIGRLYYGGKNTFQTRRNRIHIDQNDGWVNDINKVRADLFSKPSLVAAP